jgi:hypothetical protein
MTWWSSAPALPGWPPRCSRLWTGDIGAATGLETGACARVPDGDDQPIPGLYACGNDMHSAMGGVYTGPGITIGPAIVFAYIATRDALKAAASIPAATNHSLHEEFA